MAKYEFIYCNRCDQFYLRWHTDFSSPPKKACPHYYCFSEDIIEFEADSFAEMAKIERKYKIRKINESHISDI